MAQQTMRVVIRQKTMRGTPWDSYPTAADCGCGTSRGEESTDNPSLPIDSTSEYLLEGSTILDARISDDGSTVGFVADGEVYVVPTVGGCEQAGAWVTRGARGIPGATNGAGRLPRKRGAVAFGGSLALARREESGLRDGGRKSPSRSIASWTIGQRGTGWRRAWSL